MSTKPTGESFLSLVKQSGLVDQDQLKKLWKEFKEQGLAVEDSKVVADEFVSRNVLTRWQVDKLLLGKHKGFFLGKYRLLSHLGTGGMSSVYLAEHVLMRRRVAIKVLPQARVDDTSYLQRFHREAQAVAALDHRNIVRAYDVDQENKLHFLVMEYVAGQSLQELVARSGKVDFVHAAEYIRQAAEGLSHAHRAGMVHRDIKPGNLLVDEKGTVRLLDLGLARFFDDKEENSLTIKHDEKVLGTADYLAPEQALDSHTVDIRADIYSLGCTLYFILTGHPPFPEGTLAQRLMAHQTRQPAGIEIDRPDIPQSLTDIVTRMMAKQPDDRYQTARDTSTALLQWLMENGGPTWAKMNPIVGGASSILTGGSMPGATLPTMPTMLTETTTTAQDGSGAKLKPPAAPQPAASKPDSSVKKPAAASKPASNPPSGTKPPSTVKPKSGTQTPAAAKPPSSVKKTAPAKPASSIRPAAAPQPAAPPAPAPHTTGPPPMFAPPDFFGAPAAAPAGDDQEPELAAFLSSFGASPAPAANAKSNTPAPAPSGAVAVPPPAPVAASVTPAPAPQAAPAPVSAPAPAPVVAARPAPAAPPVAPTPIPTPAPASVAAAKPSVTPVASAPAANSSSPAPALPWGESEPEPRPLADDFSAFDFDQPAAPHKAPAAPAVAVAPPPVVTAPPAAPAVAAPPAPAFAPPAAPAVAAAPAQPAMAAVAAPAAAPVYAAPAPAPAASPMMAAPATVAAAPVMAAPVMAAPPRAAAAPVQAPVAMAAAPAYAAAAPQPMAAVAVAAPPVAVMAAPVAQMAMAAAPVAAPPVHMAAPVAQAAPMAALVANAAPAPYAAPQAPVAAPAAPSPKSKSKLPPQLQELLKKKQVVIGGGIAILVVIALIAYSMMGGSDKKGKGKPGAKAKSNAKSSSSRKSKKKPSAAESDEEPEKPKLSPAASAGPPVGAIKSEYAVPAQYPTIAAALAAAKKSTSTHRRALRTIKVAGGSFTDPIEIDESYPQGIVIIADPPATLTTPGSSPAIVVRGSERARAEKNANGRLTIQGLRINASGKEVGIQLSNWLMGLHFKDVEVTGFGKAGIVAEGLRSYDTGEDTITVDKMTFAQGAPTATGIVFKPGASHTSSTVISGCRFMGPLATGISFEGQAKVVHIAESIFSQTGIGVMLGGENVDWKDIVFSNDTFYQNDRGIVIANMPGAASSGFAFYNNLFLGTKGMRVVVDKNMVSYAFSDMYTKSGVSVAYNWTDSVDPNPPPVIDPKAPPAKDAKPPEPLDAKSPVPKEVRIFDQAGGRWGANDLQFLSTDPANPEFLAPGATSPQRSAPAVNSKKSKPYIGAVAPK